MRKFLGVISVILLLLMTGCSEPDYHLGDDDQGGGTGTGTETGEEPGENPGSGDDSLPSITSIKIEGVDADVQITDSIITVTVPYMDISAIKPVITHSGDSISPASGAQQDFSSPVWYDVYDSSGFSYSYEVTVKARPAITSISFNELSHIDIKLTFDYVSKTDASNVTYYPITFSGEGLEKSDLTSLTPDITYNGDSISPDSGVSQDFSSSVYYTVSTNNGKSIVFKIGSNLSGGFALSFSSDSIDEDIINKINPVYADENTVFNLPTVASCDFYRTGYNFDGWATESGGSVVYADGASYTMEAADKTLYAVWSPVNYNINYHLNGGINSDDNPATYTLFGSDITLKEPTRSGYKFNFWTTEENLDYRYEIDTISMNTQLGQVGSGNSGEIDLYASWTEEMGLYLDYEICMADREVMSFTEEITEEIPRGRKFSISVTGDIRDIRYYWVLDGEYSMGSEREVVVDTGDTLGTYNHEFTTGTHVLTVFAEGILGSSFIESYSISIKFTVGPDEEL